MGTRAILIPGNEDADMRNSWLFQPSRCNERCEVLQNTESSLQPRSRHKNTQRGETTTLESCGKQKRYHYGGTMGSHVGVLEAFC